MLIGIRNVEIRVHNIGVIMAKKIAKIGKTSSSLAKLVNRLSVVSDKLSLIAAELAQLCLSIRAGETEIPSKMPPIPKKLTSNKVSSVSKKLGKRVAKAGLKRRISKKPR